MGDAWISPLDSIMTWGPYLYSTVSLSIKLLMVKIKAILQVENCKANRFDINNDFDLWYIIIFVFEKIILNKCTNKFNFFNNLIET